MVKIEIQDVRWNGAKEVGILINNPEVPYEKWIKKDEI